MIKIFTKKLYVKKLRLENNNATFPLKKTNMARETSN